MRIPQRFTAKPLAGTLLVLACTGLLVLGLLALSLLLSLSRASHIASASSDALHPFTITSPDFHDGGPLSRKAEDRDSPLHPISRQKCEDERTAQYSLLYHSRMP